MSFRIYNNIPKTIITPQIKTLSIPIDIQQTNNIIEIGASVPQKIYILACKVNLTKKNSDKKQFSISFINPDNPIKDKSTCQCVIQPDQLVGFNNTYIIPINKNTSLSLLNELTYGVEPQQAVLEFSYYEL